MTGFARPRLQDLVDPPSKPGQAGPPAIAWAPDGAHLAYRADQDADDVFELFTVRPDGTGNVRASRPLVAAGDVNLFAWAPDGSRLAYLASALAADRTELFSVRPDGSDERVVVREGSNDGPSWANDSRHLAFSSRRGGVRAVYVVDLYSGLERRLTSGYQEAITPAWSRE